jgi:hypothetical protein
MGNIISKNLPTKYETGYVYKIYKGEDFYIGSTRNIGGRLSQHLRNSIDKNKRSYKYKLYSCIRENGGMKTWEWKILDIYYNISRKDLQRIEGDYQKQLKPNLNSVVAGRTYEEWYVDNRGRKLEVAGRYRDLNRDKLKLNAKKWREENREKHLRNCLEYSAKNKERNKEKIPCPSCSRLLARHSIAKHRKRFHEII